MKKPFPITLVVLLIASMLAGCGVPQEDYDKVVSDLAAIQTEIARLETELVTAQEQNRNLQTDLDAAISEYESLYSECQSLQNDFDTLYSATNDLTDTIAFANLYAAIMNELMLPTITGDALAEACTIDAVEELVAETGDDDLQEKFNTWVASPLNKNLATEVLAYAMLKVEELVFEYEFTE